MNAEFWKQMPPSGRDLEIYRSVRLGNRSTRDAARDFGLSQTRIVQITHCVEDYVRKTAPSQDGDDKTVRREQVWIAETLAAEQIDQAIGDIRRLFDMCFGTQYVDARGNRRSTSVEECRYALTIGKLALLGSKIGASLLQRPGVGEHRMGDWQRTDPTEDNPNGVSLVERDPVNEGERPWRKRKIHQEATTEEVAAEQAVADQAVAHEVANPPEVGCSKSNSEQAEQPPIEPVENDASDLVADICGADNLRSSLRKGTRIRAVQNRESPAGTGWVNAAEERLALEEFQT